MKTVERLLEALLGISLLVIAISSVAFSTVWNADYLQSKVASQQVADDLAGVLPDLVAKLAGSPDETKAAISAAATPEYIRGQLSTLVPQLVAYYRDSGEQPLVDLRDFEQRVTTEGLVLPANIQSYVATPQPASAGSLDAALRVIWRWTSILRWAAPLAAAVCAVLIFAVLRKGRWLGLAIGALIGAALTFAAAFLSYTPSPLVVSALSTSNLKALGPVAKTVTDSIAHDQLARYISWGKGYATAAGVLLIIHLLSSIIKPRLKAKPPAAARTGSNGMPEFN